MIVSPPPPYVVQGPKLFCTQIGTLYHVLPTPKPLEALPVGSSNMTNVPICGRRLVSCTNRYLIPVSISPKPSALGPVPAGANCGLLEGRIAATGTMI